MGLTIVLTHNTVNIGCDIRQTHFQGRAPYGLDNMGNNGSRPVKSTARIGFRVGLLQRSHFFLSPHSAFHKVSVRLRLTLLVICKRATNSTQTCEGWQKMPLQNKPLWHKDYFDLKAIKTQKDYPRTAEVIELAERL